MTARLLTVDAAAPDAAVISEAAAALRAGCLVAFPTETVYGLGANALDPVAVARIFAAKGRPATNPLIVHVTGPAQALELAAVWPPEAVLLAQRFWPGPLSLVLPRTGRVCDAVTGGGPTVALRMPAHPVALALLEAAGVPAAAPSANRSTRLSPTTAQHVARQLGGQIDIILDAGPCAGGIESTVLDLTTLPPRVLRPGLITAAEISAVIAMPVESGGHMPRRRGQPAKSPGQMARHYAPLTRLVLTPPDQLTAPACGRAAYVLLSTEEPAGAVETIRLPSDPRRYAARLYATLHHLDELGLDVIVVEMPPDTPDWAAVRDRLMRAAR
ncbi:MAG: L-threonylcarbamoyladenylate synthase [Candidatus Sumerlaeaceae bacterium]|nr:L-threonylcarbamoyladenylate synthase [Candidatus Sumerlaeaceae bacterium]